MKRTIPEDESQNSVDPGSWLWLVAISTDGTFEVFDHVDSIGWPCYLRAVKPELRIGGCWVRDQYKPRRWLIPAPDVVEHHYTIVSAPRENDPHGWHDKRSEVEHYALDLSIRLLGLEKRVRLYNRRRDGLHHCPHCGKTYAATAPFRKHVLYGNHRDGGGVVMYRDDFRWKNRRKPVRKVG